MFVKKRKLLSREAEKKKNVCIVSFSQWLPFLQNLWQKWRTRFPVYSTCSIPSRWLAGPPLLSCQPRGARLPLPSSRSSSATTRLLQHCRLHLAARVQRVAIDLNVLQRREPRPTQGQPSIGFTLLCPSQEVTMVL